MTTMRARRRGASGEGGVWRVTEPVNRRGRSDTKARVRAGLTAPLPVR